MTATATPPAPTAYLAQGPFTDPRALRPRLRRLVEAHGRSPRALAEAVRGVLVHVFWRHAYGLPEDRARAAEETGLHDVATTLARAGARRAALGRDPDDPAPLPVEHRLNGNCRHHSVLYAALLREAGVPARARCGFARYFEAGKGIDHWVVERWEGGRWVIGDPQLDDVMLAALRPGFDPLDLPDGAFVSGGEAWLACRAGDDPDRYGIFELRGWDFVKGNLVRDLAALAGCELLPWEVWGLAGQAFTALTPAALAVLDAAARATPMRTALAADRLAGLAAQEGFRVPPRVQSWVTGAPVEVDVSPWVRAGAP